MLSMAIETKVAKREGNDPVFLLSIPQHLPILRLSRKQPCTGNVTLYKVCVVHWGFVQCNGGCPVHWGISSVHWGYHDLCGGYHECIGGGGGGVPQQSLCSPIH